MIVIIYNLIKHIVYIHIYKSLYDYVIYLSFRIRSLTEDEGVVEAVRWSMALAAKIMVRTVFEGSTLVMKAINANSRWGLHQILYRLFLRAPCFRDIDLFYSYLLLNSLILGCSLLAGVS